MGYSLGNMTKNKKALVLHESFLATGATGIEPAIFGLTGRRVNHYTTPPLLFARKQGRIIAKTPPSVKF